MKITAIFMVLLLATGVKACAAESVSEPAAIENGRLVAQSQCAGCHAIGGTGPSPHAGAPVFRTILTRYRPDVLEQELVERIKIGHAEMPQFSIRPAEVSDLVAYLRSIQQLPE